MEGPETLAAGNDFVWIHFRAGIRLFGFLPNP